MLEHIKSVLNNNTAQGRVDVTLFFIDVFLLLCHIVLMIIYIFSRNALMITANIFSVIIYSYYLFYCIKKVNEFLSVTFLEILIHIIFAVYSFGWDAGFQNWTFALVCACFLLTYTTTNNIKKMDKRTWIFSALVVIAYFVLYVITKDNDSSMYGKLFYNLLYVLNSLCAFFSIGLFSLFYTSKTMRRQNELSRRADYDELTSLYNRYALNHLGNNFIQQAKGAKAKLSVAIIDIDHFKKINDTYGHSKGDEVLKELSSVIRSYSVRGIVPGRWGGEEFIMIAPYTIDYDEFCVILEKLREKVEKVKFHITGKKQLGITISIGSSSVDKVNNLEDAVSYADKNLYQAKETGRNKLVS